MTESEKSQKVTKKGRLKRILKRSGIALGILLLALISVSMVPAVQDRMVSGLVQRISEATGFKLSYDYVYIKWFDEIAVLGLEIKDPSDSTMIWAPDLVIDFDIASLIGVRSNRLDAIRLTEPKVSLVRHPDSAYFNIDYFVVGMKDYLNPKRKPGKPTRIHHLQIVNGSFSLNDQKRDSVEDRFDQFHFRIEGIQAQAFNFRTSADTLEMSVAQLSGINPRHQLEISQLHGEFQMHDQAMHLHNLEARIGQSVLLDSISFLYSRRSNLSYFVDSVTIGAHLNGSRLDTRDLAIFAPDLEGLNDRYKVSGNFKGKVGRFSMKNLDWTFGNRSVLRGEVAFNGLPDIRETFIELNFRRSQIDGRDLIKYVNAPNSRLINKFGLVDFNGEFLGFLNDFVAYGSFQTALGQVVSDIKLELSEDPAKSKYDGRLKLIGFDAGDLISEPDFQLVDMNGDIQGTGLTLSTADFQLNAAFDRLGFKGYDYQNIVTNARLTEEFFQGLLEIDDPNLRFTSQASIDLREGRDEIKVDAELEIAFLKNLKLTTEDLSISSIVDLDVTGLQIDSIVGTVGLRNIFATLNGRTLYIDSIEARSDLKKNHRSLVWKSDRVGFEIAGDFDFTSAFNHLSSTMEEYRLILLNQRDSLEGFYARQDRLPVEDYQLHYRVDLRDINPFLSLVAPGWAISTGTVLEGDILGGSRTLFTLQSQIDTLFVQDYHFLDNEIGLSTSKTRDSTDVLAFVYLFSNTPDFKPFEGFRDLSFEGVWQDDHIDWRSGIYRSNENQARISGNMKFQPERTTITMNPSDIVFLGNRWEFIEQNLVAYDNYEWTFEKFGLYNQEQKLVFNGVASPDSAQALTFRVDGFELENLSPLVQKDIAGRANGYAVLHNLFKEPIGESEMEIDRLTVGEFLVGDLINQTLWDPAISKFRMDFNVKRDQEDIIDIHGLFDPLATEEQLDLDAKFARAHLNIVEPFVSETFSEIGGDASGDFKITGNLQSPVLSGQGFIEGGEVTVNYLKTHYTFNGQIFFDRNEIGVRDVLVFDAQANQGRLNGGILHNGFRDLTLDLTGDMSNFNVLNTSLNDNELFYGNVNVSGQVNFRGTLGNLTISANAKTEKGTRIFIPMGSTSTFEQKEFIQFVSFRDSTFRTIETEVKPVNLTGLTLDFDLEVTPDAYSEIIFDIKTGDIIRGRGRGNFQLETQGEEFNMFGDFALEEGFYNFTLYSLINKEFTIQPGSRISWYGDPYEGILDIKANYRQYTSMAPILADTSLSSSPDVRRAYPTTVILDMQGLLLSPEIDFDIIIEDFPQNIVANGQAISLQTEYDAFKNKITTDEQELKRQVFSLIILKRFSVPNSFELGGGGTLGSSVSEFISNQLFYWMSQVDENLEISVDLGQLDDEAFNSLQLRLSYTFLEGRLRVTGDGGQNVGGLAGAVSVESLITEDGQLRLKLSLGSNYATANSSIDNTYNYNTYRGSLVWSKSFPDFSRQLQKAREKAAKRQKEVAQPTTSDPKEEEEIQTRKSGESKESGQK